MRFFRLSMVTLVCSLTLCSCNSLVYRPDINQGNFITQKEVDTLAIGMTKEQVSFVMGSPMLSSVYENNSWYYVFRELPTHEKLSQKMYTVSFDAQNRVEKIESSSIGDKPLRGMDNLGFIDN